MLMSEMAVATVEVRKGMAENLKMKNSVAVDRGGRIANILSMN